MEARRMDSIVGGEEGARRTGSAQGEVAGGPGGQRKSEERGKQTLIYLGGQEVKGGPSAKPLFTLQEEFRAIGVGGVGLTRKMERRLGREGREAGPTQAKGWGPGQMG